jgi:hypothetical protein
MNRVVFCPICGQQAGDKARDCTVRLEDGKGYSWAASLTVYCRGIRRGEEITAFERQQRRYLLPIPTDAEMPPPAPPRIPFYVGGAVASLLTWEFAGWYTMLAAAALALMATEAYRFFAVSRPWTEEARLRRALARVERDRRVLTLRGKVEKEQAVYRTEFDRYLEDV